MSSRAKIYFTDVMHRRMFPVRYRFVYRVFSLLLDIDRLEEDTRALRLLSYNRFNLLSFMDKDHGARDGSALRPWVEEALRQHGVALRGGRILLLCFPRVLGYGFNPLSIYYCYGADGSLRAVLCEVKNTFGEQHGYLLHGGGKALPWPLRDRARKCFHVSPFISMDAEYRFRLSEPGQRLSVGIREFQQGRLMLVATQTGNGVPMTDAALMRAFLRYPLMTLKVIVMIHWQALKIWLKGGRFHRQPPAPAQEIT
ncbi:MAG: hypothetical protein AMS22_00155 [Thiotrichales bacterium SG8_50]|nr:MAG: hypothetical protein AMS22_00155 [Thiotrichales bacterium SG8_50]